MNYATYSKRLVKRQMRRIKVFCYKVAIAFTLLTVVAGVIRMASAKTEQSKEEKKIYTSYEVTYGDTLSELAVKFNNTGESNEEWIANVKKINHITIDSDLIISGKKIVIYYLDEEEDN